MSRLALELEKLGCPLSKALKLYHDHGEDEIKILRIYARGLFGRRFNQPPKTRFLKHPIHGKDIDRLLALGFSENDCDRELRLANYVEVNALKALISKFHRGLLDVGMMFPVLVRRDMHNQMMLSQLKGSEKQTSWNTTTLRALGKFKNTLSKSRLNNAPSSTMKEKRRSVAHNLLLKQRLDHLSMAELIMEGDGNCQFRSISHELYGTQSFHLHVRQQTVQYMSRNPDNFLPLFENKREFDAYLLLMSKPSNWGDELTLKAASEAFLISLHLITSTKGFGGNYLEYHPQSRTESMVSFGFLTYLSPIHYNVMTLKHNPQRARKSQLAKEWLQEALL